MIFYFFFYNQFPFSPPTTILTTGTVTVFVTGVLSVIVKPGLVLFAVKNVIVENDQIFCSSIENRLNTKRLTQYIQVMIWKRMLDENCPDEIPAKRFFFFL